MRSWSFYAAVIAVIATLVVAVIVYQWRSQEELRELPPAERHALYQRTIETLRSTCTHDNGPLLDEHCREQAELVARFEECDRDCYELARRFAQKPTR